MSQQPVRIGIIGAGAIGNIHAKTFKKVEGAEIAGITDAYLPLAEQRGQEHDIPVAASPQQLFDDKTIDAIVVGVPNQFHAELADRKSVV